MLLSKDEPGLTTVEHVRTARRYGHSPHTGESVLVSEDIAETPGVLSAGDPAADISPLLEDVWSGAVIPPVSDNEMLQSRILPLLARHGFMTSNQMEKLLPEQVFPVPYVPVHLTDDLLWGAERLTWLLGTLGRRKEWVESNTAIRDGHGKTEYWWVTETGRAVSGVDDWACCIVQPDSVLWQHTLAINDYGTAAHAQTDGKFGPYDWEHEPHVSTTGSGKKRKQYRSDALLMWHSKSGVSQQFLEMDRGTHPLQELVKKQKVYRSLNPSEQRPDVPGLVWCFDDLSAWFHTKGASGSVTNRMKSLATHMQSSSKARYGSRAEKYDQNTLFTTLRAAVKAGIGWTMLGMEERPLWMF